MPKKSQKKSAKEKKPKLTRIPKRKVIYIEIDDEITAVYDQVKRLKMEDIYIVVPKRAVLLQSIVNLKILKKKLEELDKNIAVVTSDKTGTKLAHQAGLTVYDKVENANDEIIERVLQQEKDITPIKAASNEYEETSPRRLDEKKVSIHDIVSKKGIKMGIKNRIMPIFKRKKKKKNPFRPRFTIFAPNRTAVTALIIASVLILLMITYIALPGATIYLTPKSNVLERSVNIVLADLEKNKGELSNHLAHMIATYPMFKTIQKKMIYNATGVHFKGENARGKITLINKANREWTLVPRTRFQTDDGTVFRIQIYTKVPPATADGPGKIGVDVTADEFDIYGQVVGDRGNIGPTKFFLPGLRESSRELLFGESYEPMSGGKTTTIKFISKEDLDSAGKKIKDEILASAQSELEKYVEQKNKIQGINLSLLTGPSSIKKGNPRIYVPYELEGQERENFEVSSEVEVSGVAYNKEEFTNILKEELRNRKSPAKKLVNIDENSIAYQIFEKNESAGKVKVTATIKGVEEYEIDPDKENGRRLLKKVTEHILGMNKKNAEKYIQNLPEIDKVVIKTWPMWTPLLPKVPENIEVKIEKPE